MKEDNYVQFYISVDEYYKLFYLLGNFNVNDFEIKTIYDKKAFIEYQVKVNEIREKEFIEAIKKDGLDILYKKRIKSLFN